MKHTTPATKGLSAVIAQKSRVHQALILRHIITRYGRDNLGFIWLFIEPMMLCSGVMLVWTVSKGNTEHGLNLVSVVYTGYMPLTLWRHMTGSMVHVLKGGKYLTNFREIRQLDIVLSRLFVEFTSVTASAMLVYLFLNSIGILPDIYNLTEFFTGWLAMGALGFGGGLLFAGATEASEITEKFVQPFQYLIIPFSGCFFLLEWLPSSSREYLLYVPFVHAFETIRAGFFGPSIKTFGDPLYALVWATVLAGAGFSLIERVRDRIDP